MPTPRTLSLLAALGCGLGCVFGYRGLVPFAGEATLAGIDTVRIELPPTELSLLGDPTALDLRWQGRFAVLGATRKDAIGQAEQLDLRWETYQRVGRLSEAWPAEQADIAQLEQIELSSAPSRAHEIRGEGDVFVAGIDAFTSVVLDSGNIEVFGGVDEVRATTGEGFVHIATAARVDVEVGAGAVTLELDDPRATEVHTEGPVEIAVALSDDLAIDIADAGTIVVDLDTVAHVGTSSFQRNLGAGSRPLRVRAGGGRVDLRMIEP
jgi:hypothetical protein